MTAKSTWSNCFETWRKRAGRLDKAVWLVVRCCAANLCVTGNVPYRCFGELEETHKGMSRTKREEFISLIDQQGELKLSKKLPETKTFATLLISFEGKQ